MSWANAIGNIATALGGLGSFSKSQGTDVGASMALMAYQNQLAKDSFKWQNENGYKFMRKGLVDADYNPLLAIGASPIQGQMPNAIASGDSLSMDFASGKQANTASRLADAQIGNIQANTAKTAEETLNQSYVRQNLQSNTQLQTAMAIATNEKLPYEIRKLAAEQVELQTRSNLNAVNAAYVPYNAKSTRISANAAKKTAETNATWTPIGVGSGIAAGLIGYGVGKVKSIFKRPVGFR